MKQFFRFVFLMVFVISMISLNAQDRHFSQFYAFPMNLNPALTGGFDGTYRASAIYRDQWRSVIKNPYTTFGAGFDLKFKPFKRSSSHDAVGVGVAFIGDRVGIADFSTNNISINAAYHKVLDVRSNNTISVGFQGGIVQKDITYDPLTFNDQFNGVDGYSGSTLEQLPDNNFTFGDFGLGVFWSISPERSKNYHAGLSVYHFTQPNISFFDNPENISQLYTKIATQVGASVPLGQRVDFLPRLLASFQGPHLEVNIGSNFRFPFRTYESTALFLGGWLRTVKDESSSFLMDAVIVMGGVELDNLLIGLSYDLNTSDLVSSSTGRGAFEVSIRYIGSYENESVMCPTF